MKDWALWKATDYERGWPKESHEVRAYERHMQSTVTNGIAKYTATIELEGGRRVKKLTPSTPKDTRPAASSRIPNIDLDQIGPRVDAMLKDMAAQGDWWAVTAVALIVNTTSPASTNQQAREFKISRRAYYHRLDQGYSWLMCAINAKQSA